MAEWNSKKDLLAMVTGDSKIILHCFNWQRLWAISPGKLGLMSIPCYTRMVFLLTEFDMVLVHC